MFIVGTDTRLIPLYLGATSTNPPAAPSQVDRQMPPPAVLEQSQVSTQPYQLIGSTAGAAIPATPLGSRDVAVGQESEEMRRRRRRIIESLPKCSVQ